MIFFSQTISGITGQETKTGRYDLSVRKHKFYNLLKVVVLTFSTIPIKNRRAIKLKLFTIKAAHNSGLYFELALQKVHIA